MVTLKIDYKNNKSELCEIGRKYDTDKSSQRDKVTNERHCHPYTLFYESLFRNNKNDNLKIAELGIGGSLLMWKEYFKNSQIYGLDYNLNLIEYFKNHFDNDRIHLSLIDVQDRHNIIFTFSNLNEYFDIIIEDTTHNFEDQIRVIENVYPFLKPGGMLIIEDIFKSYKEEDYITRLSPILNNFQHYYFVELDHNNRNSTGWNNDKLFILIKRGAEPIFKNENKLTIITPSYRTDNLLKIKKSIDFKYIDEWIIVYDGSKINENPKLFNDEKIKEYVYKGDGISGNPQRNYALSKVTNPDTLLYYLDDDNSINQNIYSLLNVIDNTKMYSFNQHNTNCLNNILYGNSIKPRAIDTAMVIVPYKSCKDITWLLNLYEADGYYITECYEKNKNAHIYVNNILSNYNTILE